MAEVVEDQPLPPPLSDHPSPAAASDAPPSIPPLPSLASLSLSIWPPSQRTRDAVLLRLVDTLSSPSVLTKRYGTVPRDDASAVAREIEAAAFAAASEDDKAKLENDDDGMAILQIYSREISRRMLETVKARAADSAPKSEVSASEETSGGGGSEAPETEQN